MERSKELPMDLSCIQSLKNIVIFNMENDQFGVEELAKELGVSRTQLHRKLQQTIGNPPAS